VSWVRIDDKLPSHPKWLALGKDAKLFWFHAAVWCGAHNNDGIVPEHAWPFIAFTAGINVSDVASIIEELCRRPQALPSDDARPNALMRKLARSKGGGVEFHDWNAYQPTKKQVAKKQDVDDRKALMRALHDWLHKSPPGRKVKAIVEARDGAFCCYCGEGPLRLDGDRKGSTRRTFDLIDPTTIDSWEWRDRVALHQSEILRVAGLWCVACGYCNSAKGRRAPDETDGYRILPGYGPSRDLPRSAAIQSVFNPPVGSDLAGSGAGRVGPVGSGPRRSRARDAQQPSSDGSVPLLRQTGGAIRLTVDDPAHPSNRSVPEEDR
jgi:hypothetical protein